MPAAAEARMTRADSPEVYWPRTGSMSRHLNSDFCQPKPASRTRPRSRSVELGLAQTKTFMPYSGLLARNGLGPRSMLAIDGLGEGAGSGNGVPCDSGPAAMDWGAANEPASRTAPKRMAATADATFRTMAS